MSGADADRTTAAEATYDVAIIGAGPVGSVAGNLAARHGLRCLLVDESVEVFPHPRAVHFDADIMRILQFAGLSGHIEPLTRATTGGVHLGVDGEPIRMFRVPDRPGDLGWRPHYMFYQPVVDALLRELAAAHPRVDAHFGWRCERVEQDGDVVTVTLRTPEGEQQEARARYVIAADGASSPIRKQLDMGLSDYDFDEPWVVVDAWVPDDEAGPDHTIMYCNPARPATYIPGPGRHRRWEFMLLPGEAEADVSAEAVSDMIAGITPWLDIEQLDMHRMAVYRFHALVAERWRAGRVFLVGDAAHQTPPFYGQGMCHGIRDARNLLWKITSVLRGTDDDALLDTYQVEREPHVRTVIEAAVANGRYICTLDPAVAAERDRDLRLRMSEQRDVRSFREVIPGLTEGILDPEPGSEGVGLLFVQPMVRTADGERVLLDELLAEDWALISSVALPAGWQATVAEAPPIRDIVLGRDLDDVDGLLAEWFSAFGSTAVLLRPDRYVYGTASGPDVEPLLGRFMNQIRELQPAPRESAL